MNKKTFAKLTPEENEIIRNKGTEAPFSGKYNDFFEIGTYTCKQCNASLYRSEDKFNAGCGWPSFDNEIDGAIKRLPDADGRRTEILCANCDGHLGHVFSGENYTSNNIRHCVNSVSINFNPAKSTKPATRRPQSAYFAGGCFWGVEHLMQQQQGVESVTAGYMGGKTDNPSYQQVCAETTGHLEAVQVNYDANKVSYETLARLFFEIHDPTQTGGQGPDIGEQYTSAVFINTPEEKTIVERLIGILKTKGYNVVTQIRPMAPFWKAEDDHQNYYAKSGKQPYCHRYQKKF